MKKILFLQENGVTSILSGAAETTISELEKLVPVGLQYIIIDDDQLPSEEHMDYFRDALIADFNSPGQPDIKIDSDKAREISKNIIRQFRSSKFNINDLVIRDAMISNDAVTLKSAIKERDRLRNLPEIVDDISNIDEMIKKLKSLK